MPRALAFLRPASIAEAVAMLVEHGEDAKIVAGSTAVTIMLQQRLIEPAALVSIGRIDEGGLHEIRRADGQLRIGALATLRAIELDATVRSAIPVLADTFAKVANVRVRNIATVGGLVAEADYASDPPAVLLALDARIEATGPNGSRTIPVAEFFRAFYTTALEPGEIVTAVHVPAPPPRSHAVYEKFVTRSSEDRPCVGVMALVQLAPDGATAQAVRIAVGAAAETPRRFPDLEATLHGTNLADTDLRRVADAYAERIDTLDDMRGSAWYRKEMVRVWVRRAIEHAHGDARAALAGA
ncbi:MAG: FAD binding domain-containing protein [Candidatus Limnocylindrales bacterium]